MNQSSCATPRLESQFHTSSYDSITNNLDDDALYVLPLTSFQFFRGRTHIVTYPIFVCSTLSLFWA